MPGWEGQYATIDIALTNATNLVTWDEIHAEARKRKGQKGVRGEDLGDVFYIGACLAKGADSDPVCKAPEVDTYVQYQQELQVMRDDYAASQAAQSDPRGGDGFTEVTPQPLAPVGTKGVEGERIMADLRLGTGGLRPQLGGLRSTPIGSIPQYGSGGLVAQGVDYCRQAGIPDFLCAAGGTLADRLLGGGGGGTQTTSIAAVDCPEGFVFDPDTQTCQIAGLGGAIQRTLPGGQTGVMGQGQAVVGAFGMPAVYPAVVGQITKNNGEVGPVFRCPTRMVLGADNLCYQKSALPRRHRKWRPTPKPPVTRSDAVAIRKAAAATKRVKSLAGDVGFS